MYNARKIKERAVELGSDICGIAPVERFTDAPKNFHPRDILGNCHSVIVFGSRFMLGSLQANTHSPYTLVRNFMVDKMDRISLHLSRDLAGRRSRFYRI